MDFQKAIGRPVFEYNQANISANIIRHDLPFKKNYLYIPHGPVVDWNAMGSMKNELAQFVAYLKQLAKEQKSFYIKMEPLDGKVPELMHQFGFKKSKKEINPRKTVVLDLTKSEEEILATMHHKTRYNIRVAEKSSIEIKESQDIDTLVNLMKKTAHRQKFSTHERNYYKNLFNFFSRPGDIQASIYLATHNGQPVAGNLMLTYGDTAYYLHGGSDYEFRSLMAPHALHWYLIREMKSRGFKYYDFGGSEGDKWPGITRFKLSWGARQVEYPGSFDLPISKFWYFLYKLRQ